jgi:hypothetical protein
MDPIPLAKILGDKIGFAIRKNHEKSGVIFHLDAHLEKFIPSGMCHVMCCPVLRFSNKY